MIYLWIFSLLFISNSLSSILSAHKDFSCSTLPSFLVLPINLFGLLLSKFVKFEESKSNCRKRCQKNSFITNVFHTKALRTVRSCMRRISDTDPPRSYVQYLQQFQPWSRISAWNSKSFSSSVRLPQSCTSRFALRLWSCGSFRFAQTMFRSISAHRLLGKEASSHCTYSAGQLLQLLSKSIYKENFVLTRSRISVLLLKNKHLYQFTF